MEAWPFDNAPNTACLTLWRILREGKAVLHVARDLDDGMFQFLDGRPMSMEDAALVALKEIIKTDSTLAEIADLEPGWTAVRQAPGLPWNRHLTPPESD